MWANWQLWLNYSPVFNGGVPTQTWIPNIKCQRIIFQWEGQTRQISNIQLQSKYFKKSEFSEFAMRLMLAFLLLVTVVSVNGGRSYNTESSLIENVLNIDTEKIVTNTTSEFQTQGWWSRWWRSQWWWQKWWFWRFWRQKQQWEK